MTELDFLNSIPQLVEAVRNLINTPWGFLLLLFILIWFIANRYLLSVIDIFDKRNSRHRESLTQYITFSNENSNDDEVVRSVVKDRWNSLHFQNATGIYADKKLRKHLLHLYESTSSAITWKTIKNALYYIDVTSSNVIYIREMSLLDRIIYYYNNFFGFVFLLASIGIFLMLIFMNPQAFENLYTFFAGLACFIVAIFSFFQNRPVFSSRKIKTELTEGYLLPNDQKSV